MYTTSNSPKVGNDVHDNGRAAYEIAFPLGDTDRLSAWIITHKCKPTTKWDGNIIDHQHYSILYMYHPGSQYH